MPNFTRKAIMDSCLKLLNEKPVNKITVKDIVEDCGINRNSFYYHFQDLPSLVEVIITEEADSIIAKNSSIDSFENCIHVAISFILENRKAALHLYNSVNRDIFEMYLWKISDHVINRYIDTVKKELPVTEDERKVIVSYYKCLCFGQVIDWMESGLNYDIEDFFRRLIELKKNNRLSR